MTLLISILIVLIVAGVALWLIDFIPMDANYKRLVHGVVIIAVVVWLLLQLRTLVHLAR